MTVKPNTSTTVVEVPSTGYAREGVCTLHTFTLSSAGAASGAVKCEIRDGVGTAVLCTVVALQDTTVVVPFGGLGVRFAIGVHLTISGAGAGALTSAQIST